MAKELHANASSTAAIIHTPASAGEYLVIRNEGTTIAYIGSATVTATTGLALTPGSEIKLVNPQGAISAITAAGSTAKVFVTASRG